MRAAGWLCAAAFLVACWIGASRFVDQHNARYRAYRMQAEQHDSDIRLCRMQLGIDHTEFRFRELMMACVHEATADMPAKGSVRGRYLSNAWAKCMPEMATCTRALAHPTAREGE